MHITLLKKTSQEINTTDICLNYNFLFCYLPWYTVRGRGRGSVRAEPVTSPAAGHVSGQG